MREEGAGLGQRVGEAKSDWRGRRGEGSKSGGPSMAGLAASL